MSKRARDDDSDSDVVDVGYVGRGRGTSIEGRVRAYAEHARALNVQFLKHVERKIAQEPTALLLSAVRDYARYAREIRDEFQDVLAREGEMEARAETVRERASGTVFAWGERR